MDNPFLINYPDITDAELVLLAVEGDKNAWQNLVLRHQFFVDNLALKMCRNVYISKRTLFEIRIISRHYS